MIVDAHAHAWPRWPYPGHGEADVDALLRELDAAEVDRALVVAARLPSVEDDDDYLVEAAERHPGRLDIAVEIDGRWSPEHGTPGAVERLERWTGVPGVVAVALYPHVDDTVWLAGAGDERVARAVEGGLLVSLAATPSHYALVGDLAARHPSARFLLHHLGLPSSADLAGDLGRLAELLTTAPGVHVKLSGPWYAGGDTTTVVDSALTTLPADRLLWGSDSPAGVRFGAAYRDVLDRVRTHPALDASDRAAILGGTYARVRGSFSS